LFVTVVQRRLREGLVGGAGLASTISARSGRFPDHERGITLEIHAAVPDLPFSREESNPISATRLPLQIERPIR
jgi:hypothetical protein